MQTVFLRRCNLFANDAGTAGGITEDTMADTHYEVDETLHHARQLMEPARRLRVEFDRFESLFGAMAQMRDGDGSQASHFQKVVDLFGVKGADSGAKLANAKVIFDELNSAIGNSAALVQLLAKLG